MQETMKRFFQAEKRHWNGNGHGDDLMQYFMSQLDTEYESILKKARRYALRAGKTG